MIQPFEITQEQLKDIDFISPAGVNYNLHLGIRQHFELSKSGKTLTLVQLDEKGEFVGGQNFIVSKTVFCLKTDEVKQAEEDFKELVQIVRSYIVLKDRYSIITLHDLFNSIRDTHNFDEDNKLFDINFKSICATIKVDEKDGIKVLNSGVEVYKDGQLYDTREIFI